MHGWAGLPRGTRIRSARHGPKLEPKVLLCALSYASCYVCINRAARGIGKRRRAAASDQNNKRSAHVWPARCLSARERPILCTRSEWGPPSCCFAFSLWYAGRQDTTATAHLCWVNRPTRRSNRYSFPGPRFFSRGCVSTHVCPS